MEVNVKVGPPVGLKENWSSENTNGMKIGLVAFSSLLLLNAVAIDITFPLVDGNELL